MDRENDYNPCLSPYDIQNGGIYDLLSNGQVTNKGQTSRAAFRAMIVSQVLKSYSIIVLDLSKWETVGLMSKSITMIGKT